MRFGEFLERLRHRFGSTLEVERDHEGRTVCVDLDRGFRDRRWSHPTPPLFDDDTIALGQAILMCHELGVIPGELGL